LRGGSTSTKGKKGTRKVRGRKDLFGANIVFICVKFMKGKREKKVIYALEAELRNSITERVGRIKEK